MSPFASRSRSTSPAALGGPTSARTRSGTAWTPACRAATGCAEHPSRRRQDAGNYLGGQLIKLEALANGFAEAIALGPYGMLSEGSGQNLFLVIDGVLHTPPIDGTMLPGITRSSLLASRATRRSR